MAEVGGHADFGHRDEVAGKRVVMHVATLEDFAQHMPYLLADAEQADRSAFGSFDFSQLVDQTSGRMSSAETFSASAKARHNAGAPRALPVSIVDRNDFRIPARLAS